MRIRSHERRFRVEGRHLLALFGAALVVVSAAIGLGLVGNPRVEPVTVAPALAPAWKTGAALCRQDPMTYVPHPTRFVVVAACSTISGTVKQVRRDPVDGELNMLVDVDSAYDRFLLPGNQGVLRTAAVPRDIPNVKVPKVGQHATLYGSWVLDRNQRNQAAMHPVWKVVVPDAAGLASRPAPAASPRSAAPKRLWVDMRVPPSVPVGGAINLLVRVESGDRRAGRPLAEANLSFDVRDQDGRAVQWKAATTNALGMARVTLVALEHPGSFRLWLYVDKQGRSAVVSAPVMVRRR